MKSAIITLYIAIGLVAGVSFKLFGNYSYMSFAWNIGQGLAWPVTLFADDPEIDGSTRESFGLSYQKVGAAHKKMEGQYRLTTGMNMLALLAYAEQTPAFTQTEYDRLYKGAEHSFKIASEIIMKRPDVLDALRKKTDGMDFSDIVDAAPDASKELQKLLSSRQGQAQLPMPEQQPGQAVSVRVIQVRDNRVSTVAGDLRAASEDPSGEGTKRLLLNGKALDQISDDHITLLTVYRYDDRDVVLFTHACGGSACGFTSIGILELPAQGMPRLIASRELTINTDGAEPDVRVQPDGGLLLSFEGQTSPQRWRYLAGQLTKA